MFSYRTKFPPEGIDIFKIKGLRARLFVLGFRFLHVWNSITHGVCLNPQDSKAEPCPGEAEHIADAKRQVTREAVARRNAAATE